MNEWMDGWMSVRPLHPSMHPSILATELPANAETLNPEYGCANGDGGALRFDEVAP
jgi:hypothetical protein